MGWETEGKEDRRKENIYSGTRLDIVRVCSVYFCDLNHHADNGLNWPSQSYWQNVLFDNIRITHKHTYLLLRCMSIGLNNQIQKWKQNNNVLQQWWWWLHSIEEATVPVIDLTNFFPFSNTTKKNMSSINIPALQNVHQAIITDVTDSFPAVWTSVRVYTSPEATASHVCYFFVKQARGT